MEKSDKAEVIAERIAPKKKYHLQVRYSPESPEKKIPTKKPSAAHAP